MRLSQQNQSLHLYFNTAGNSAGFIFHAKHLPQTPGISGFSQPHSWPWSTLGSHHFSPITIASLSQTSHHCTFSWFHIPGFCFSLPQCLSWNCMDSSYLWVQLHLCSACVVNISLVFILCSSWASPPPSCFLKSTDIGKYSWEYVNEKNSMIPIL